MKYPIKIIWLSNGVNTFLMFMFIYVIYMEKNLIQHKN